METIDINEVFAQANVVENLKNFAGIDAQNALSMMTPERLAAVVGGKLGILQKVIQGNADSTPVVINCRIGLMVIYDAYNGVGNVLIKDKSYLHQIVPNNTFISEGNAKFSVVDNDRFQIDFKGISMLSLVIVGA